MIGGGVIGLEIAWELKKAGLAVTVIELATVLMERLLDKNTAHVLRQQIEQAGIQVVTGAKIKGIDGQERAEAVSLEGNLSYPADLVVMSTGVRGNIGIAKQAGLSIGRSIIVTERMATSEPDLYACGDCAEYAGVNTATWLQSIRQGAVAGANAAGEALSYQNEPSPILVHTARTALFSTGDMAKGNASYEVISSCWKQDSDRFLVNPKASVGSSYFTFCFLDGKLVGASLIGDLSHMQFVQEAVCQRHEKALFSQLAAQRGMNIDEK